MRERDSMNFVAIDVVVVYVVATDVVVLDVAAIDVIVGMLLFLMLL